MDRPEENVQSKLNNMQSSDPITPLDVLIATGADERDGHSKENAIVRSSLAIISMISSFLLIWTILRSTITFKVDNYTTSHPPGDVHCRHIVLIKFSPL